MLVRASVGNSSTGPNRTRPAGDRSGICVNAGEAIPQRITVRRYLRLMEGSTCVQIKLRPLTYTCLEEGHAGRRIPRSLKTLTKPAREWINLTVEKWTSPKDKSKT